MFDFPFITWFFHWHPSVGAVVGRCVMIAVILFTAYAAYRLTGAKKAVLFLICFVLWLAAELLYHFGRLSAQMFAAFFGIPALLIWVGIAVGCLGRFLVQHFRRT